MASSARRCAKGSSSAVRMCAASSTTTSSETLRCRPSTTKRGVRAPGRQRSVPLMPRSTVIESRTSVIAPVPRLRYHRGLGPAAARLMRVAGQAPTVTTAPSAATSRAGRPSDSSHRGADAPRTIAAVLAVLASTHEAAATVTVRHTGAAGSPVRGSTMWWTSRPARRQRRTVVLDVARPPPSTATRWPSAPGPARWSSVTRTSQPPGGTGPAVATSPPRLTSVGDPVAAAMAVAARSAASALAVAPRSRRQPGARRSSGAARRAQRVRQPAAGDAA